MLVEIEKMYLSADYEDTKLVSPDHDSTDVIVRMTNGEQHVASFFSYKYLANWKTSQKNSKENLDGAYFWTPNMVIVEDCTRENIVRVVKYLIDEGDFKSVFKKIASKEANNNKR